MKTMEGAFILCLAGVLPHYAMAADGSSFALTPVLLDGKNSSGSTIGLKYEIVDELRFGGSSAGGDNRTDNGPLNPERDLAGIFGTSGFVKANAAGTWTVDKADNPASTAQVKITGGYGTFQESYSLDIGGFAGLEGDQDYRNRNSVYGVELGGYYGFSADQSTYVAFVLDYGQVDASKDQERMVLTTDDAYYRASGELQLSYGLKKLGTAKTSLLAVQLNYRYYKEIAPPAVIRERNLDTHGLATLLFKFNKGLYVAYSSGSLPFDKQNDKVFEIGFSQNIF